MAIVTKAAKERARADAAFRTLCPCGHSITVHFEYRDSVEMQDGQIVRVPHPKYRPCLFKCNECDCEVQR